jgi:hypothetical protein
MNPPKRTPPAPQPKPEDQWRPHTTPGFEINGKGQLRTAGHLPGNVPTKRKTQVVIEDGDESDWYGLLSRAHR